MGFKGKFELTTSTRISGVRFHSFVLKCTNLLLSETVDCMISDEHNRQPFFFRGQTFKAGRSYRFDFDTVDWQWCQHDYFAILDNNDKIVKKWQLNLKEYKPGECPECHGTLKCKKCNGQGVVYPHGRMWEYKTCDACGGTGTCHTCDIPRRPGRFGGPPTGIGNGFK